MKKTHHRIHVILTVAQYEALRKESTASGVPLSEIVRRSIAARLATLSRKS